MVFAPLRINARRPVVASVSLEPVYNALTSLSLLNAVGTLRNLDPWLTQTAAALTPEQRHRNQLVFEGLGEALILEREAADFPAYLDALASERPMAMRDRLLRRLTRPISNQEGLADATELPRPSEILADPETLGARLAEAHPGEPPDRAVVSEVHALLNDPPALHDLVVSHLGMVWGAYLAEEWKRRLPFVQRMVMVLGERDWSGPTAAEAIRNFTGRELPLAVEAQLDGVRQIRFVLSPHVGFVASRFGSDNTLWVFVRARVEDLPVRQTPVKRVEIEGPLAALADATRLRILELVARNEEMLAQEIMSYLDLSQPSVSRHLKQLRGAGFLLEQRVDGANKSYRLNPGKLDWTFRAVKQLLSGQAEEVDDQIDGDRPPELRRILDSAGRVQRWPASRKQQIAILNYLVTRIPLGQRYNEKEFNGLLNQWHLFQDPAVLRRDMFDLGLIDRTRDGSQYWRVEKEDAGAES